MKVSLLQFEYRHTAITHVRKINTVFRVYRDAAIFRGYLIVPLRRSKLRKIITFSVKYLNPGILVGHENVTFGVGSHRRGGHKLASSRPSFTELVFIDAFGRENLNPVIFFVNYQHIGVRVNRQTYRIVKLAQSGPLDTKFIQNLARRIENPNPMVARVRYIN